MATTQQYEIAAWSAWQATPENPKPDVARIPPMERRRLTGVERAALSVALDVANDEEIPVVFASRWGEIGVTAKLMQQFQADGEMSPAGFSASVHNAAPGAFSLLTRNHAPYTAIAARDRSLEAGLLEALAMCAPVLFVYAEEATPDLYRGAFGEEEVARSVAVRLVPAQAGVKAEFRLAESAPALSFAALTDFLGGRTPELATASFTLRRG